MGASMTVGAVVFTATWVYLVDRIGWGPGLVLGWAPALIMGLAATLGHLAFALILAGKSGRAKGPEAIPTADAGMRAAA